MLGCTANLLKQWGSIGRCFKRTGPDDKFDQHSTEFGAAPRGRFQLVMGVPNSYLDGERKSHQKKMITMGTHMTQETSIFWRHIP